MTEEAQSPQSSEPLKLVVLDQSQDALDAARDRADERLNEELSDGGRVKKFFNGIWKGNIAKDYYRQKYTLEASREIEASQNILTHARDLPQEARTRAIESTIERFQGEYDELIHTDAGERREVQEADSDVANRFKDLIRQYAEGRLNDVTLKEERTRLLQELRGVYGDDVIGRGLVTTDNMIDVARSVMGAVQHGESIDSVLENMQVITGEARSGVRTEANYNWIDKTIDRLSKTKVGSLVAPETIAAAVTIAASVARLGSQSVVGAAAKTLLPGAAAGFFAGLRENKRVKDERSQHARERAQGKEFHEFDRRRTEMEAARYESVSATDLVEHLSSVSQAEVLDQGNDALRAALDALAAVETRVKLSDQRSIDLVSFSSAAAVGDERMALDVARAEAKVALSARLSEDVRRALGLDENATLADIIGQRAESYIELIDQDAEIKDRAFARLKARRVATAAAVGVATGIAGGLLIQEGIAAADPTRAGLLERAWGAENVTMPDGTQHQTVLEGFVEGDDRIIHTEASSTYETYTTAESGNGQIILSNEHSLVENGDGTVSFIDGNGAASLENIPINEDGSFPESSIDAIEAAGWVVEDNSFDQEVVTTTTEVVDGNGFVENHIAETTAVTRELWYGNDTPGIYDQNELRVYRGGSAEAPGIISGGYQYTVAGMRPEGSWQGGESIDWNQAAASGNLFMAVSATVDTQSQVFMVPIGPDGAVNISADSPAGHFFENRNGSVAFTGAYAEIVQTTGVNAEGEVTMRPLATMVGEGGRGPITDTVTTTTVEHHAMYTITSDGYEQTIDNFTEMAPVTPIISRRSMETPTTRRQGYYYMNGEYLSSAEIQRRRTETSPRLLDNPNAALNPQQELSWYRKLLRKKAGAERVERIDQIIESSDVLKGLSGDIRAIVTIPVKASQTLESESIYRVIERAYAAQDRASLDQTMILLNVNWYEDEAADPVKKAAIDQTLAEIERAKADFPYVKIASFESVYNAEQARETGGIIGYVARDLYDTALLGLEKAMSDGRIASDRDVLIIRNDADPKGMSTRYLGRFIEDAEKHPETDVFTGTLTFDSSRAEELPGFQYATNFMQLINTIASVRDGNVHFVGANGAVRASSLAAVGSIGFERYTGVGSDDKEVGNRIVSARTAAAGRPTSLSSLYRAIRGGRRYRASGQEISDRKIGRRVAGARIESDSDRLEKAYRVGIPVIKSWDNDTFDGPNGYIGRSDALSALGDLTPEDLRSNPDPVIDQIIEDMNASIRVSNTSESVVRTALAFTFSGSKTRSEGLSSAYTLRKRSDGTYSLSVTPAGRQMILNHMMRDGKGRFESYAARKRRQLYGEAKSTAKKQATNQSMRRV